MLINDYGIVLSFNKLQERNVLLKCFLKDHGLISGYYKIGRNISDIPVIGTLVSVMWKTRVIDQLGAYKQLEKISDGLIIVIGNKDKLNILSSVISILMMVLKEKEPQTLLWLDFCSFMKNLEESNNIIECLKELIFMEISILKYSGFGLDLKSCVVSKSKEELVYLSPKSGKAVSFKVGEAYHDKLFPLPAFLVKPNLPILAKSDLVNAFNITTFFLKKHLIKHLPITRNILIDRINCDELIFH